MPAIEGVQIIPLKKVVNERGHLLEVQRADDPHYPGFGQAYVTCTLPGVIKAWYRHKAQTDQVAVIKGEVALVLYDSREASPTFRHLLEVTLGEQAPRLVRIPPGIWHGFKAAGDEPAYLLHLNSAAFNFAETDEERLPADSPAIPYRW
jgi:dTDP-4-dehydrorhamnose 3,5-epimerase